METVLRMLAVALCAMAFDACPAGEATPVGDEPNYYATARASYKKLGSPRFNFWFDIPVGWRAFDRSANGDGYFLEVGDAGVDVRAYGAQMHSRTKRASRTRFVFADGGKGWREAAPGRVTYVRPEADRVLCSYVEASAAWMKQNADAVAHVARSLRPGSARSSQ